MRYGSVCSGIEAPGAAWLPLGWEPRFFSEIEPFPNALLAHHYPAVPNLGDMTKHDNWKTRDVAIDVFVGGTPCQDFSVAGLRAGLAGARGSLTLEFVAILEWLRPQWFVFENVPGILSADDGRAFETFLNLVGQRGYGFAYRIYDCQYFGLAQRRERVFVVGYLGDWRPAAAVLFEPESLRRHSPPRRETQKDLAPTISARTSGGGGLGTDFDLDGGLVETAVAHTLKGEGFDASEDGTGRNGHGLLIESAVRRLTPMECERLMGFPDGYTLIPFRGKPASDSVRYKALGNSIAVPVLACIGRKIEDVTALIEEMKSCRPGVASPANSKAKRTSGTRKSNAPGRTSLA